MNCIPNKRCVVTIRLPDHGIRKYNNIDYSSSMKLAHQQARGAQQWSSHVNYSTSNYG